MASDHRSPDCVTMTCLRLNVPEQYSFFLEQGRIIQRRSHFSCVMSTTPNKQVRPERKPEDQTPRNRRRLQGGCRVAEAAGRRTAFQSKCRWTGLLHLLGAEPPSHCLPPGGSVTSVEQGTTVANPTLSCALPGHHRHSLRPTGEVKGEESGSLGSARAA